MDAQAAADEAAKTYQSVKQKLEENEQAKSELEQAKENVTVQMMPAVQRRRSIMRWCSHGRKSRRRLRH